MVLLLHGFSNKEERQNLILQFVEDSIETSQYKIINHVKKSGMGTQNTVINDINDLAIAGKLVKTGDQYNLRIRINHENQFIRINQMLSEIEKCIVKMNAPMRKIIELKDSVAVVTGYKVSTMYPYIESVKSILWHLLELVNYAKFSKEDSQQLHVRIIELIVKMRNQYYDFYNAEEIIKNVITDNTNTLIKSRDGFKNNICSVKTYDCLITLNKKFEKEFLS
jgi:hypothetical protein